MVTDNDDNRDQYDSHVTVWRVYVGHGVLVTIAKPPPLSAKEFAWLAASRCPDCGGFIWREGPRAGIAQNVECKGCKSRFNLARWYTNPDDLLNRRIDRQALIMADRIERVPGDDWREDMFPQILE